jgi:molybdopterin converting factor small subunit
VSNTISLNIKFFGCLGKYNIGESLSLNAIEGETVLQIKERLISLLNGFTPDFEDHDLISVSALSHAHQILTEDSKILASGDIFVLPPVCGG